jgi:hypothetical protein
LKADHAEVFRSFAIKISLNQPITSLAIEFASEPTILRVMADGFGHEADDFDYDDWLYVEDEFDLVVRRATETHSELYF